MAVPRKTHVDSNVILRYLTGDPAHMAEKAARLLQRARDGEIALVLVEITVAEVVWVLQSFYRHGVQDISKRLMQFLLSEGIESPDRDLLLEALLIYGETGVKFGDALLAAHVLDEGQGQLFSFDEHFDRIAGISRLVPGEEPSL